MDTKVTEAKKIAVNDKGELSIVMVEGRTFVHHSFVDEESAKAERMRAALTEIRERAATMENGGAFASGLAAICLAGTDQEMRGRMMTGYQQERSEAERSLPDYIRDALDRARALIGPFTNAPITREQAARFVNAWLPEGDPGRM